MEKISKAQVKFVRSLQLKKVRDAEGLFVAEGEKCVEELRRGFELVYYIQTAEKPQAGPRPATPDRTQTGLRPDRILLATPAEIEQMSSLKTPQGVIGVFKKNGGLMNGDAAKPLNGGMMRDGLILVLDGVQDPGNLGTIIRTCDWFGVHDIVCSKDTADCYNPKVVQATMGALCRVRIHYVDLKEWLAAQECSIIGTLLEGGNMYESPLPKTGIIVMGNEGNGISQEVRKLITHPVRIPSYPKEKASDVIESLNVAIATAIVLAEFRR